MENFMNNEYYSISSEETLKNLNSSKEGITEKEAKEERLYI